MYHCSGSKGWDHKRICFYRSSVINGYQWIPIDANGCQWVPKDPIWSYYVLVRISGTRFLQLPNAAKRTSASAWQGERRSPVQCRVWAVPAVHGGVQQGEKLKSGQESCRTSRQVFCLPSCKVFGKRIAADQKPHDGFLLCPLCWTLVTLWNKDPLHHWNLKAPSDRGSIALPTWGFPGPPHQRPRVAHDVTETVEAWQLKLLSGAGAARAM